MSITINDPNLIAQLQGVSGSVVIQSPTGQVLGEFHHRTFGKPPPGYQPPFTDAEMEEFRKHRSGRPLEDVLRDLESGKLP